MFAAHEAKFYYVTEEPYGATPTNPAFKGLDENVENIDPSVNPGNIPVRGCGSRDLAQLKKGLLQVGFKLDYIVPADDVMQCLQHIITLYPQTCEVIYEKPGTSLIDLRFSGCRFDKETVRCSVEDVVHASIEAVGQNVNPDTARLEGASYTDFGGAVPFSSCYVQRGDADGSNLQTIEEVTDWEWTITNNLKRVPVIRSTNGSLVKYLLPRSRNLTGKLTFEFENRTRYYEAITDAEFSLKFGIGPKYVLFTHCKWDNIETPTKFDDLVSLNAQFTACAVEFEDVTP